MSLFKELYAIVSPGMSIAMQIQEKNGKFTISVLPDGIIQPLIVTGTPEDLDAGFIAAISTPLAKAASLVINEEAFNKELDKVDETNKGAAEKKAAASIKSSAKSKKIAPAKSKPETKKAAPASKDKKAEKKEAPKPVKEEIKPTTPQQLTIG